MFFSFWAKILELLKRHRISQLSNPAAFKELEREEEFLNEQSWFFLFFFKDSVLSEFFSGKINKF